MTTETTQAQVSGTLDSIVRLEDCRENFRDADGRPFVVRCPKCKRENWAIAVAGGECCWCGWAEANATGEMGPLIGIEQARRIEWKFRTKCATCKWRSKYGWCENEDKVNDGEHVTPEEYGLDHLVYSYNEGGRFWVGPDFGCVHHEEKQP